MKVSLCFYETSIVFIANEKFETFRPESRGNFEQSALAMRSSLLVHIAAVNYNLSVLFSLGALFLPGPFWRLCDASGSGSADVVACVVAVAAPTG